MEHTILSELDNSSISRHLACTFNTYTIYNTSLIFAKHLAKYCQTNLCHQDMASRYSKCQDSPHTIKYQPGRKMLLIPKSSVLPKETYKIPKHTHEKKLS